MLVLPASALEAAWLVKLIDWSNCSAARVDTNSESPMLVLVSWRSSSSLEELGLGVLLMEELSKLILWLKFFEDILNSQKTNS